MLRIRRCLQAGPATGPDWEAILVMTLLRRATAALAVAALIAAGLRLRGTGGTPPQSGGWRELRGPELR